METKAFDTLVPSIEFVLLEIPIGTVPDDWQMPFRALHAKLVRSSGYWLEFQ